MYDVVKTLHIITMIVWICGMIGAVLVLAYGKQAQIAGLQRFNRFVISPAMILVWAAGITMAVWYGWFSSGWLSLKLVFVIALSGLHGFLSANIRKAADGGSERVRKLAPVFLLVITACTLVIVVLATSKPF